MTSSDTSGQRHWLSRLIDAVADVGGAAIAASVVQNAGAQPALLAASAAGISQSIKIVASEIEVRLLAPRERYRLTLGTKLIVETIKRNYEAGRLPREDAFFRPTGDARSASEEIFEGTMLAIQRDPEERKLAIYSKLFANIAFDSRINRATANQLLSQTERLTYRQLALIAFFGGAKTNYALHDGNYRGLAIANGSDWNSLMLDVYELGRSGLLFNRSGVPYVVIHDVNPAQTQLIGIAFDLYRLADMHELQQEMKPDFDAMAAALKPFR